MAHPIAQFIVNAGAGYAALGLLFAIGFSLAGWRRVAGSVGTGTPGFRLLIIPGAVLLWPLLLVRSLRSPSTTEEKA